MENNYKEYKQLLKERLDEKRYKHSLAVADEAVRLSRLYGADEEKAYLAGLLHDITKNATREEHLNIFSSFDIMLSDIEKNSIKLWHAISGAEYIKHVLKIADSEIISAVRYHTTAKAGMSLLEKVIYLADFTSADRDYDDVHILRGIVNHSLDDALLYALSYSIKEVVDKKSPVHPDTLNAFNEITLKGNLK